MVADALTKYLPSPAFIGHRHVMMGQMRVEFLLKTDSGHPKDTGVTSLATPIRKIHLLSSNMQF